MRIPSQIYTNQVRSQQIGQSQNTSGEASGPAQSVKPANQRDVKVSVSAEAKQLAEANAIDVQKVERLRAAIDNGTFEIDSTRIAEKILERG